LKSAERVELGNNASLWPSYLRGLAYLRQGADATALLEFRKILDHKGVLVPKDFNPAAMTLYPLASIGRARAAARSGDVDASRSTYGALLEIWKYADSDMRIVGAARREYLQVDVTAPVRN
jgi:hypothetical protein